MNGEKIAIRAILCYLWIIKELSEKAVAKEINDVEGTGTVNEYVVQNWFRCFKEGDTSHKDKPRSGRPSVVEDEDLLEMVEQQPSTSTCTLSTEHSPSQSPF